MTNFLVLKAHAGITFIAFYQYGRQYYKEAQLPLKKKKKEKGALRIIHLRVVLILSLCPSEGRRVGFGRFAAQQGVSNKNPFKQCSIVSSVSPSTALRAWRFFLALQSSNFNF